VQLIDTHSARGRRPRYIGSEIFRRAAFGAHHPLNIVRHSAVFDVVTALGWLPDDELVACSPASTDTLSEFHDRAYIRALQYADAAGMVETESRNRYQIGTRENPLFDGVFERAATTVDGSIRAALLAIDGHTVFHPSGGTHHGRPDRASGFCYFNDPVFAILTFLDAGCTRIAYVDLDAHHGDGVEDAFQEEPRVRTISIHEAGRWPYTGSGGARPERNAFNFPVPPGFNDSELEFLVDHGVLPLVESCDANALVICCGADCLAGDPLSGMQLSNVALWDTVDKLLALGLPTVVLGGGGYNPWTVTRYWAGLWGRIAGRTIPTLLPEEAARILVPMECELIDEDEIDESWLTTMADSPYPGPVRDDVRSLLRTISREKRAANGLA
jgi:acetoin utilization protein AcuC